MYLFVYAEAEAAYLQGQGIARQRQAIVNGLRESVLNFEDGVKAVTPQEVIELMMVSHSSSLTHKARLTQAQPPLFSGLNVTSLMQMRLSIEVSPSI